MRIDAVVIRSTPLIVLVMTVIAGSGCGPQLRSVKTNHVEIGSCDTVPKAGDRMTPRLPGVARREEKTGALVGVVDDRQTGRALSGVVIRIRGEESRDVRTDTTGGFFAVGLPPGPYGVIAVHLGYDPHRDSIQVVAGRIDTVRYHLQYRVCP